nr:unknown [Lotus japonicus]
MYLPAF